MKRANLVLDEDLLKDATVWPEARPIRERWTSLSWISSNAPGRGRSSIRIALFRERDPFSVEELVPFDQVVAPGRDHGLLAEVLPLRAITIREQ
jgi:hypothetical protein